jgi:hypothetical protein
MGTEVRSLDVRLIAITLNVTPHRNAACILDNEITPNRRVHGLQSEFECHRSVPRM